MCRPDPETFSTVLFSHGDLFKEVAHLAQLAREDETITDGRSPPRSCGPPAPIAVTADDDLLPVVADPGLCRVQVL